ncbi:alpha/beta hydrolase [Hyphobacterium marinum]|uniref:Alpha/beta hydrolase n=1 Tax=Hyphobacterium marinum TaxID=3116574 RepID=A0ABU7LX83_9PROT|nr:alpha/beta hydrolase [Hyphobacterium sp. Y6023]MEE2566174.1 alpha/beta hydrolase [Hyphobacterium sp. Y6023]
MNRLLVAALGVISLSAAAIAQDEHQLTPARENVIYGMVSGAAMLMDVYGPEESNGLGVIVIPGSGWYMPEIYSVPPLKDLSRRDYIRGTVAALTDEGFTVFVINHRSSPGNRFPAAVEDTRRAVRFVRAGAEAFGIDPERIGILGHSSGGNLAAMAAYIDDAPGNGVDPIDQQSSAVQAVVTLAAPFYLYDIENVDVYGAQTVANYVGVPFYGLDNHYETSPPIAVQASPTHYVDAGDPPLYMVYSADDPVVPESQADHMIAALDEASAPYTPVRGETGEHAPDYDHAAMTAWLERVLGE